MRNSHALLSENELKNEWVYWEKKKAYILKLKSTRWKVFLEAVSERFGEVWHVMHVLQIVSFQLNTMKTHHLNLTNTL